MEDPFKKHVLDDLISLNYNKHKCISRQFILSRISLTTLSITIPKTGMLSPTASFRTSFSERFHHQIEELEADTGKWQRLLAAPLWHLMSVPRTYLCLGSGRRQGHRDVPESRAAPATGRTPFVARLGLAQAPQLALHLAEELGHRYTRNDIGRAIRPLPLGNLV